VCRADTYRQMGAMKEAIVEYRHASTIRQMPQVLASQAYCHARLGQHNEGVACYLSALEAGLDSTDALNNLGYCLRRLHLFPEAHRWLTKAIEKDPTLQPAFHNRARVDLELALGNRQYRPVEGLSDIERAIELGPVTGQLLMNAASLFALDARFNRSSVAKALDYLRRARERGLPKRELEQNPFFAELKEQDKPAFEALLDMPDVPARLAFDASYLVEP
jgi:tetratricopeptide (TPR) repeat protein